MKLVIGDKSSGKTFQIEVPKDNEGSLIGLKIGQTFDGGVFGASGYTLKITGGSDAAGFPMRRDVEGPRRISTLLTNAPGFRQKEKGERKLRRVRGNIISDEIMQINCTVDTAGSTPLSELLGNKKEEKKE
jgi:small subunit ribosomal protein S6e